LSANVLAGSKSLPSGDETNNYLMDLRRAAWRAVGRAARPVDVDEGGAFAGLNAEISSYKRSTCANCNSWFCQDLLILFQKGSLIRGNCWY
jgi:hypothetical protein